MGSYNIYFTRKTGQYRNAIIFLLQYSLLIGGTRCCFFFNVDIVYCIINWISWIINIKIHPITINQQNAISTKTHILFIKTKYDMFKIVLIHARIMTCIWDFVKINVSCSQMAYIFLPWLILIPNFFQDEVMFFTYISNNMLIMKFCSYIQKINELLNNFNFSITQKQDIVIYIEFRFISNKGQNKLKKKDFVFSAPVT